MNEFKIEINLDETIVSYRDFKNYINRAKNQNSEFQNLNFWAYLGVVDFIFLKTRFTPDMKASAGLSRAPILAISSGRAGWSVFLLTQKPFT